MKSISLFEYERQNSLGKKKNVSKGDRPKRSLKKDVPARKAVSPAKNADLFLEEIGGFANASSFPSELERSTLVADYSDEFDGYASVPNGQKKSAPNVAEIVGYNDLVRSFTEIYSPENGADVLNDSFIIPEKLTRASLDKHQLEKIRNESLQKAAVDMQTREGRIRFLNSSQLGRVAPLLDLT